MELQLSLRQEEDLLHLSIATLIDRTIKALDAHDERFIARDWTMSRDALVCLITQVREELFNERKRMVNEDARLHARPSTTHRS